MNKLDNVKDLIKGSFRIPLTDFILVDGEKLFYLMEHLRLDFQENRDILHMIDEIQEMAENEIKFPLTDLNIINGKKLFMLMDEMLRFK